MTQHARFFLALLTLSFAASTGTSVFARSIYTVPTLGAAQDDDTSVDTNVIACTSDDQCPDFMPYCLDGSCSYYAVSCTYDPVVCSIGSNGGLCVCGDGSTVTWGGDAKSNPSPTELMTQCELSAQHYCSSAFPHDACQVDDNCSDSLPYCENGGCQPNLSCVNPAGTCVATRFGIKCDCITGVVVVANEQSDADFPPRSEMQATCLANLENVCGNEPPPLPLSCIDDALAICTSYAEQKMAFDRACVGTAGNNQPYADLYECCVNEYWANEIDQAAVDCIAELGATTCSEWLHGWWSCTSGVDDDIDDSLTDATDATNDSSDEVTESDTNVTTNESNDETTDGSTDSQDATGTDTDTEDDQGDGPADDLEEWLVSCDVHGGSEHGCTLGRISTPWIAALAAFVCARRRRTKK